MKTSFVSLENSIPAFQEMVKNAREEVQLELIDFCAAIFESATDAVKNFPPTFQKEHYFLQDERCYCGLREGHEGCIKFRPEGE